MSFQYFHIINHLENLGNAFLQDKKDKNGSNPRKQITEKKFSKLLETWEHALEFNINKMISLEYQLKVVLNSG